LIEKKRGPDLGGGVRITTPSLMPAQNADITNDGKGAERP
jgi:hypothetical protein